jgi:hypothetical protein
MQQRGKSGKEHHRTDLGVRHEDVSSLPLVFVFRVCAWRGPAVRWIATLFRALDVGSRVLFLGFRAWAYLFPFSIFDGLLF